MVNAVLRRVSAALEESSVAWESRDPALVRVDWRQARRFATGVLPDPLDDGQRHLAAAVGEYPERVSRWLAYAEQLEPYGRDRAEAELALWASQAHPVTVFQRNPRRATPASFREGAQATLGAGAVVLDDVAYGRGDASVYGSTWFADGEAYVQDCTAHEAARLLEAQPGERVLDLCAAPGGKTMTIATAMGDEGQVVAADISAARVARIEENARRLGVSLVRTVLIRPEDEALDSIDGEFDAALVDAPCSNSGVLARRPEARRRLRRGVVPWLPETQLRLLWRAARRVRSGGRLVYSTCSVEREENEAVVTALLEREPAWRLAHAIERWPRWGDEASAWRDGGFAALLRRA